TRWPRDWSSDVCSSDLGGPMTDKIVVLSTCETAEQAAGIARRLVEARLAACVNIVPGARSIYQWKGAVEEATEVLLLIKTSRARSEERRVGKECRARE